MNIIQKSNIRLIEAELYTYNETKNELKLLEDDIIDSSPFIETAVQSDLLDSTASKVIKLSSSKELLEIRRRINAIEKALSILSEEKMKLVRLKYFERKLTDIGIINELHIGSKTYYRWKKEIIELIGSYLGWKIK